MTTRWMLLGALGLLVACGHNQRTVYLPATTQGASTAPTTTSQPTPPPPPAPSVTTLELTAIGPGPRRVASTGNEELALAFTIENLGPDDVQVRELSLAASGRLDDAAGVTTVRLGEDLDGDGAYDRSIDRIASSGGFTRDDGEVALNVNADLRVGETFRGLIVLDFAGTARAGDDLRLTLLPAEVKADRLSSSGSVVARGELLTGPVVRVGGWVEPHLALTLPGDGLWPKAVRDNAGNTHLAVYQNYNGNSDVFYSFHDGRSYSPADDVSRAPTGAWNQDLAVDDGRLPHLVWEEWDTGIGDYAIRYRRFDPVAFGWTPVEAVSNANGLSSTPRVAVTPAGDVHVVWEDGTSGRVNHRVKDAGGTWSSIAEVSSATGTARAWNPALAVLPTGDVLLAWAENDGSRSEVRTRRAQAGGGYSAVDVAARPTGYVERPELLVDGGDVHLAYVAGGEIYYTKDGGAGFSQPVDVSRSPLAGSKRPTLVVHGGALHLLWIEADVNLAGLATHVAHAEAVGGSFGDPELLTRGPGDRAAPTAVSEGSRLRVIWQDWSLGRQRIFSSWKEDGLLEAPRTVAAPGGDPSRPAAADDGQGGLHVAYSVDAGGGAEVFVASEPDPINGFALPENVSKTSTSSYAPTLASFAGDLWAAWEEDAASGFEVRVARRTAGTWASSAAVSSNAPAYSPKLAASARELALLWTEATGQGEHHLRLKTTSGQGWSQTEAIAATTSNAHMWNPDLTYTAAGDLALVWEEESPSGREARLALRTAAGLTHLPIAGSPSAQFSPKVAALGADLHVAWLEDGRVLVATLPAGASAFDPPVELAAQGGGSVDLCVAGADLIVAWEAWSGSDARVLHATFAQGAWSAATSLDLSRGPSRKVTALGGALGGARLFWTDGGSVLVRERRER